MARIPSDNTPADVSRAQRFPIRMLLRYRLIGQVDWLEGSAENISRSGVLFRGQSSIEPGQPLEMTFVLPVQLSHEAPAEVICLGHVVRKALPQGAETRVALGVTIENYRFLRGREPSSAVPT